MEHIFCIFLFIRVYAYALHPQVPKTIRSTRLNMFNQVVTNVSVLCNVCLNQTKMVVMEFQDPNMPLSRAEIQKRYRERKKLQKGRPTSLVREHDKRLIMFLPICSLALQENREMTISKKE